MNTKHQLFIGLLVLFLASCNGGSTSTTNKDSTTTTAEKPGAGPIAVNPLKNCYFGDLHLHPWLMPLNLLCDIPPAFTTRFKSELMPFN